jgi:hypothetical protein
VGCLAKIAVAKGLEARFPLNSPASHTDGF